MIYIAYDARPPHLPIAVADSPRELAEMIGSRRKNITALLRHHSDRVAAVLAEEGQENEE